MCVMAGEYTRILFEFLKVILATSKSEQAELLIMVMGSYKQVAQICCFQEAELTGLGF